MRCNGHKHSVHCISLYWTCLFYLFIFDHVYFKNIVSNFPPRNPFTYLQIYTKNLDLSTLSLTMGLSWWLRRLSVHLQCGRLGLSPRVGRSPRGGHGNPLQYSCLENPHEHRSLADYSPMESQRVGHDWALLSTHSLTIEFHSTVEMEMK